MLDSPAIRLFRQNWFLREEQLPDVTQAEGRFIEAAIGGVHRKAPHGLAREPFPHVLGRLGRVS